MLDALFADMAVTEATDLILAHAFGVGEEGFVDAARGGGQGSGIEEEAGAGLAVVPNGQGGVEIAALYLPTASVISKGSVRLLTNSRRRSSNISPSIVVPKKSGGFSHGL